MRNFYIGGMTMNKSMLLLTLMLSSFSLAQAAEELRPEHLQQIESLQRRADKLVFGALGANNYHLAKARAWLDFALGEYYQKDRSGIVPATILQAEALLDALDEKQANITMDTPVQLQGSEAVHPDLWGRIAALKDNAKFSCGQRQIAEAEVALVWTGHKKAGYGWSYAQSYARSAEDRIYEAQVAINNCAGQAGETRAATIPQAPSATTTVVIEKHALATDTLFAFDSAELILGATQRLDKLAETIKGWNAIEGVTLVGHTDRYGSAAYNQNLSEQRAERIRQYLIGKGIADNKIHASGAGATQPLLNCSTSLPKLEQISCLQPNRRVEIMLHGVK